MLSLISAQLCQALAFPDYVVQKSPSTLFLSVVPCFLQEALDMYKTILQETIQQPAQSIDSSNKIGCIAHTSISSHKLVP